MQNCAQKHHIIGAKIKERKLPQAEITIIVLLQVKKTKQKGQTLTLKLIISSEIVEGASENYIACIAQSGFRHRSRTIMSGVK
jgi:hypothetical protein